MTRPKAIVCDLDGTLLSLDGIGYDWALGKRTDYSEFHRLAVNAKPIVSMIKTIQGLWDDGYDIVISTAREESWKPQTMAWLEEHKVPWNALLMRPRGDLRPDREIKYAHYQELQCSFRVAWVYDDSPEVIKMYEGFQVPVMLVPGWPQDSHDD